MANLNNECNYAEIDDYDQIGQIPQTTDTFVHPEEHGGEIETNSTEDTVNEEQRAPEHNGKKDLLLKYQLVYQINNHLYGHITMVTVKL